MRPFLLSLLLVSAAAPLAHADTFQFTFNGTYAPLPAPPDNGPIAPGTTLDFSYQLSVPPVLVTPGDGEPSYLQYPSVPVSSNSIDLTDHFNLYQFSYSSIPNNQSDPEQDITFLTIGDGVYDSYGIADLSVPQGFYTGSDANPVFHPGTFDATFEYNTYSNYDGTFTVTDLSTGTTPTPEPSTLLLFGTGLAASAVALRRRLMI